jgi:NADP-dependent 3-hydroxy acid dehydrogenase YdfG
VIAAGRDAKKLHPLATRHGSEDFATVAGDISTEAAAAPLWDQANKLFGGIRDIVVSVNAPNRPGPLMKWTTQARSQMLSDNVLTHLIAVKTFLSRMSADGMLLGNIKLSVCDNLEER